MTKSRTDETGRGEGGKGIKKYTRLQLEKRRMGKIYDVKCPKI